MINIHNITVNTKLSDIQKLYVRIVKSNDATARFRLTVSGRLTMWNRWERRFKLVNMYYVRQMWNEYKDYPDHFRTIPSWDDNLLEKR